MIESALMKTRGVTTTKRGQPACRIGKQHDTKRTEEKANYISSKENREATSTT